MWRGGDTGGLKYGVEVWPGTVLAGTSGDWIWVFQAMVRGEHGRKERICLASEGWNFESDEESQKSEWTPDV